MTATTAAAIAIQAAVELETLTRYATEKMTG
jgi:hypothetical protein